VIRRLLSPSFPTSRFRAAGKSCLPVLLAALAWFAPTISTLAANDPIRPIANMFDPLGTPAKMIHDSSILVSIICLVIFIVVTAMLVYVVIKFPSKGAEDEKKEPPQVYGSSQIELAWTVIPILITIVLILVTTRTIGEIQDKKLPNEALRVRVIGHQWWWELEYLKQDGVDKDGKPVWKRDFITANELHIPVSDRNSTRPTQLILESVDVIHSYWVPQLNGKTDVVPNRTNHMWLDPWETGTYLGNCAEYCGTQHANMLIRVIVQTPEDFEKWCAAQRASVVEPPVGDALAVAGKKDYFANSCVSCHSIAGTVSRGVEGGVFGPDLTHFASRASFASGMAPITLDNIRDWLRDPHHLKPGVLMPNMQLTDTEVDQIAAYLMTLK